MPRVLLVTEKLKGQYAERTLKTFVELLKTLDRYCDIDNPVDVLRYVEERVPKAKKNYWDFYKIYARFYGIPLSSARFRKNRPVPYVPPGEMLEDIIRAVKKAALRNALRIMKATGCRVGELK
jgi:integrase